MLKDDGVQSTWQIDQLGMLKRQTRHHCLKRSSAFLYSESNRLPLLDPLHFYFAPLLIKVNERRTV